MATGGLYGNSGTGALVATPGAESSGLYGNSTNFGGTYFEWFIFQVSDTQPATPTGGSWSFSTNTGTAPSGWTSTPPANPTNTVWVSISIVTSRNTTSLTWSVPGKFSFSSGLPILSGSGAPLSGDGQTDQLYIQLDTTPQTIWFKETGTWTRLTGSTLYADLTSNQTIAGTKTFSSQIQGSISGNAANVTGTVAITNGGTGSTTAGSARAALGAAASGANSDITSLTGLTTALSLAQGGTGATTAADARTNLGLGSAAVLTAGAANGVATLDAGGTVPLSQIPASIQGGVSYQGTWNATTNTPTLTSSVGTKGYYYVVSVAGSTDLNGITSWNIGDWAIFNGTAWEKIDNTDAVTSVNGYTGTVVLTNTDISGFGTMSTQNANAVAITGGTATLTSLTVNDNTTFGSSNSDTTTFNGRIASEFTPSTANTYDLGRNSHEWRNLYLTGTANISALTASGAVTLSGGTANGVAYLNGSKVLTTGSALVFDGTNLGVGVTPSAWSTLRGFDIGTTGSLSSHSSGATDSAFVSGNAYFNGTNWIYKATSTATQYKMYGGVHSWYTAPSGTAGNAISFTQAMTLDVSGNLGIGTSSPTSKLVVGDNATTTAKPTVAITDTTSGASIALRGQSPILSFDVTSAGVPKILMDGAGIEFKTGTLDAQGDVDLKIDSSGNVGIGTSSPGSLLQVEGAISMRGVADVRLTLGSAGSVNANTSNYIRAATDLLIYNTASGRHSWEIGGTERMRLDSSGNVGIGTSSPAAKLDVAGNAIISTTNNTNAALRITQLGTGNALLVEDSSNPDSSPFVIDASGNVVAGYTSAITGTGPSTATSPTVQIHGTTNNKSSIGLYNWTSTGSGVDTLSFNRSLSNTIGTFGGAVTSGVDFGVISFSGDDGTSFIEGARIYAEVDGTPGTNDMPGRLVFSTTADGASTPTERMRIDNAGRVILGGSQAYAADGDTQQLQIQGLTQASSSASLTNWSATQSSEPNLVLAHSRSGAIGTHTASVANDNLGNITFCGSDGSIFNAGVAILAEADGTWSGSSTPARVAFFTVPSGSTSGVEAISLTSGQGLQISRTAVTSPVANDGNVFSGTYTPTLTNTTNIAVSSASIAQYMRVGSVVTVSGQVDIDPTATGDTVMGLSLPIASNLANQAQASGTFIALSGATFQGGSIYGDGTNNRATFRYAASSASNFAFQYTFTYQVI